MSIEGFIAALERRRVEVNRELAAGGGDKSRTASLKRELKDIADKLVLATRERIQ